jgi:serine/threonine protein kinase
VLLADFGLVRMQGQRLTETGQILGTLLYMSPEQLLAGHAEIDGRADVYSLGATLFELLTLRPPLQGRDARETLSLILKKRPPSLRALAPDLPRDLEAIVSRTLEKDPADRYAHMRLLRDDLAAFAAAGPVRAKPRGWIARVARRLRPKPKATG